MNSEELMTMIDAMFVFQKDLFVLKDKLRELDAARQPWEQLKRAEQNPALAAGEEGQAAQALTEKSDGQPADLPPVADPTHWLQRYGQPKPRLN